MDLTHLQLGDVFEFRFAPQCTPQYMTKVSAACDLVAREAAEIPALGHAKVPTGVWIEKFLAEDLLNSGIIPELQIRARSGLAYKKGLMLTNGVGTIDADYRDEICVLLFNSSQTLISIAKGERIAQMLCSLSYRLSQIPQKFEHRVGGFGSTSYEPSAETKSIDTPS